MGLMLVCQNVGCFYSCSQFFCSLFFWVVHYTAPKYITLSLIIRYECWSLTSLPFCRLFLNYPTFILPLCFYLSLFCIHFFTYSMTCCVIWWLTVMSFPFPASPSLFRSRFSSHLFSLPTSPLYPFLPSY